MGRMMMRSFSTYLERHFITSPACVLIFFRVLPIFMDCTLVYVDRSVMMITSSLVLNDWKPPFFVKYQDMVNLKQTGLTMISISFDIRANVSLTSPASVVISTVIPLAFRSCTSAYVYSYKSYMTI